MHINKRRVQKHFDRHAVEYDHYALIQRYMANQLLAELLQLDQEKKYSHILEIGCGTGILTELMLARYPEARYTAIDLSEAMIRQTKMKLGEAERRIHFLSGDAEKVDDTWGGDYDLIISNATFQWFNDMDATMKQYVNQLLAPTGVVAFATFGSRTFQELHASFQAAEERIGAPQLPHGQAFLSAQQWRTIFSAERGSFVWKEEERVEYFPSVADFLYSVKRVGAGNATESREHRNITMSRRLFAEMEAYYSQHFIRHNQITATYHLGYGFYQSSSIER